MIETSDTHYPGSKAVSGFAEWICERLPDHVYYAEPFAGKGGVFRQKIPSLRSFLIDRDAEIVDWWNRIDPPGTIVSLGDGIRFCELAAEWGPDDLLVYIDAPYLPETRVKKKIYRYEMTFEDHVRLLTSAVNCRCSVVISGYSSELYESTLKGWNRYSRWVQTRGTPREEILWTNRDPVSSSVVMEYSELGESFRERERINRKAQRWASRLMTMPPGERRAVMLRMIDANFGRIRNRQK